MCGIVGYFIGNDYNEVDKHIVFKMNRKIIHRGPDSEGYFFDKKIGLGMRRLKVIDLFTGDQPIYNENKNVVLIFNGEIYNFLELKKELSKKHLFKTRSDSEVLVHGYEEWGIRGLLERINGMFAFCIYDMVEKKIFLARDRFGEKPLYYYIDPNKKEFLFSSELNSLMSSGRIEKKISQEALFLYLALSYIPGDFSIIDGIKKLLPSNYLEFDLVDFSYEEKEYWELKEKKNLFISPNDVLNQTKKLLISSVEKRLISDVPLGLFLSGGIDSSILAIIMRDKIREIETFSIGFEDNFYDESFYSLLVSKKLNTNHHHFIFDCSKVKHFLPFIVKYMDEPCGDQALLPLYWLSHEARKYVTVVLSGEGGDEIFGGYSYYNQGLLEDLRVFKKRFIHFLLKRGPETEILFLKSFLDEKRFITKSNFPLISDLYIRSNIIRGFDYEKVGCKIENSRWYKKLSENFNKIKDPLRKLQYIDIKSWLPDDLLSKFDRMTMANSLEGRAPYLDHNLVKFAFNLPKEFKISAQQNKKALRDAFSDKIPEEILHRKKQGFIMPMNEWLKKDLRDLVLEILDLDFDDGLNNEGILKKIVYEHLEGKIERGRLIYSILVYKLWIKFLFNKEEMV
ncbi:MAG: asparagine synthase (glutamine-hydrolyzing) [Brevinematia bacterium]